MQTILRHPLTQIVVSILVGILHGFSIAPAWGSLEIACLVVFFLLLWYASNTKVAIAIGFAFGLGWFCTAISWIFVSIHTYGHLSIFLAGLGTFIFAAVLSSIPLAFGLCSAYAKKYSSHQFIFFVFALPALWGILEWLRSWIFTGFPWAAGAYAHLENPFAGYAPLIGSDGINYLNALVAGLLCLCLLEGREKQRLKAIGSLAIAIAIVIAGAGLKTISWSEPGERLNFRLLQGGVDQNDKFTALGLEMGYSFYLKGINTPGLSKGTIVILPETVLPFPVFEKPDSAEQAFVRLSQKYDVPIIFGGFALNLKRQIANAAMVILPNGTHQTYLKKHLVPFGEMVPWGFRWFIDMLKIPMVDLEPGSSLQDMFVFNGIKVIPTLCYEDLFPAEIREWWEKGESPGIIVNLSNLAWFGDSLALPQHLGISRMRAMEFSRPVVRASNTGATAVINVKGEVTAELPFIKPGILDATATVAHGEPTPFAKYGSIPILIWMLLVLGVTFRRAFKVRRFQRSK
ncbi:MAG: apolipoprotein N-acyltransferase [Burkholderiales bacterium]|nr:apolipoprotein N-acyltransferase [Burkholderiales bacterium]